MSNTIVVFGSSGFIGRAVCDLAKKKSIKTIGVGRTKNKACNSSYEANFANLLELEKVIQAIVAESNSMPAFVFCQRYNATTSRDPETDWLSMLSVELNPYFAMKNFLVKSSLLETINIVSVTSKSALISAQDVDYAYHVTKGAQRAAAESLDTLPSSLNIYSNIVAFGDIVDNSRYAHDDYHVGLFSNLRTHTAGRPVPSANSVSEAVLFLCEANRRGISGQTLLVDAGLSNISQESILRTLARKQSKELT
jgi:NAD(P)-dependent dehydrogenase (short-subunit alcohol dehydrogenase family)